MRIPKTPPDIADLFKTVCTDQQKFLEVMQSVSSGTSGSYFHWDELLYRKPPEGLTHEEWWLGLKMSRIAAANMLPSMLDKKGSAFSYNRAEPIPERLRESIWWPEAASKCRHRLPIPRPETGTTSNLK